MELESLVISSFSFSFKPLPLSHLTTHHWNESQRRLSLLMVCAPILLVRFSVRFRRCFQSVHRSRSFPHPTRQSVCGVTFCSVTLPLQCKLLSKLIALLCDRRRRERGLLDFCAIRSLFIANAPATGFALDVRNFVVFLKRNQKHCACKRSAEKRKSKRADTQKNR